MIIVINNNIRLWFLWDKVWCIGVERKLQALVYDIPDFKVPESDARNLEEGARKRCSEGG